MQNGLETVVISSPGARTAVCQRVGPPETADSQRYYKVESQEKDLTGQLGKLEESMRERNRQFEAKLCAIEERARQLQAKIVVEGAEREDSHTAIMALLQNKLTVAVSGIESWVDEDISQKFTPGMLEQEARIDANEAKAHEVHYCLLCIITPA
jgi:predicted DNA-binding WGR domain protein